MTPPPNYMEKSCRNRVVFETCNDNFESFTVVLKQAMLLTTDVLG